MDLEALEPLESLLVFVFIPQNLSNSHHLSLKYNNSYFWRLQISFNLTIIHLMDCSNVNI